MSGVGEKFGGEGNREVGAAEEQAGEEAFGGGGVVREPVTETDGVPVEDELREKWAAEEHHDPIAVKRGAFGGSGDIVERHRTVAEAEREGAETGGEEREEFGETRAADVGGIAGEADIDVMKREVWRDGGEVCEKGLHHEALAMHRGRGVGEDEKLARGGKHGGGAEDSRSKVQDPEKNQGSNSQGRRDIWVNGERGALWCLDLRAALVVRAWNVGGGTRESGDLMSRVSATTRARSWVAAGVCAGAGLVVFQFFGNATRGYVDTASVFWWWVSQWLDLQAETEHGWLVLGISAWVLGRNLKGAQSGEPRAESRREGREVRGSGESASELAAYGVMALALGLHAVGFVAQQTRVSIVAVLLFAWGVLRLGGGKRWGDAAMFPLGFLLFAVPLNVLDSVGFWLRLWVIDAAGPIARAGGIEVVRSGTQLFAPDGRYQYDVAAACSGVRSLMALAALSLLVGYLNFRTWWRRGLMLALCFPLTYLGNVTRIAAIIYAAQIGGQTWGERAHEVMGFGVFAIVLGGVLGAAGVMRRVAPEIENRKSKIENRKLESAGSRGMVAVVAVVALAAGEMFFLGRVAEGALRGGVGVRLAEDGRDPVALPAFVGTEWIGRRAEVTAVEREILPKDTGFSRRNYVSVSDARHAVFVSIVLSGKDRTSIHRPELCLVGQGWTLGAKREVRFEAGEGGWEATLLETEMVEPRSGRRIPARVAYWFVGSEVATATHWGRFWHDAWNRLRGRADRWAYVLVQTDAVDGDEAALARMREVVAGTLADLVVVK